MAQGADPLYPVLQVPVMIGTIPIKKRKKMRLALMASIIKEQLATVTKPILPHRREQLLVQRRKKKHRMPPVTMEQRLPQQLQE